MVVDTSLVAPQASCATMRRPERHHRAPDESSDISWLPGPIRQMLDVAWYLDCIDRMKVEASLEP